MIFDFYELLFVYMQVTDVTLYCPNLLSYSIHPDNGLNTNSFFLYLTMLFDLNTIKKLKMLYTGKGKTSLEYDGVFNF